jgi:intracellular septation protein A
MPPAWPRSDWLTSTVSQAADPVGEDSPPATPAGDRRARLRSIAIIVIFDVGGPLLAYGLLRAHGFSAVTALILSGVLPAVGVGIGAVQHRRIDVIGVLVLAGIAVGTVLGLITHNAHLVLIEGSVPTALFGVACLASLSMQRPLIYAFALEFAGRDSAQGREMIGMWQYPRFQHVLRVMTVVWGVGYLVEAAIRVVIVEHTSTGTALASSKILPFVFAAVLIAWTVGYGRYQRRKG